MWMVLYHDTSAKTINKALWNHHRGSLTRSRDAWKLSHLHPLDSCNVRFKLANNAYVILCSVVWFHTKRKPHNDFHKSGFFTTFFALRLSLSSKSTALQLPLSPVFDFTHTPKTNSIPAYLINVDANTSTVGSQYRGVDGLWSRCLPSQSTPKSDMWIEDHQEAKCSGNSPNVCLKCGWKESSFVHFCPFLFLQSKSIFDSKGITQQSSHPCLQPCPLMAGQSTLKLTSLSGLLGLWVVPGMYEGQGSWTGQELGWSKLPGSLSKVVPKEFGHGGTSHGWSIEKQETQHHLLDSLRSRHCISAPKSSTCSPRQSIQLLPPNHFFHSPEHSALAGMIRRRSSGPVQLPTVVTGLPVDNSSLASRKNWGWPNQCLEQTERVESPSI